jgi:hypothetical protein
MSPEANSNADWHLEITDRFIGDSDIAEALDHLSILFDVTEPDPATDISSWDGKGPLMFRTKQTKRPVDINSWRTFFARRGIEFSFVPIMREMGSVIFQVHCTIGDIVLSAEE